MLKVVQRGEESDGGTAGFRSFIDEIVRDGARKMLAAALQAEVAAYVDSSPTRSTRTVVDSWSAMATTSRAQW